MNKIIRRLMLGIAVLAFISLAPVIVIYAMGYRFGVSQGNQYAVGVLIVESIPRRAEVVVDGVQYGRTPQSVPNLEAGEVAVEILRDGYQPWRKNVNIEAGKATEIRGIRLVPENPEITLVTKEVSAFSLSPNREMLAILDSSKVLHVKSIGGEIIREPIPLSRVPDAILWSSDNAYILLEFEDSSFEIATVAMDDKAKPLPMLDGVQQIAWQPRLPGRLLMLGSEGRLASYSIGSGATLNIAENVIAFAPSSRSIFTLSVANELIEYNLQGQHLSTQLLDTPSNAAKLLVTPAGRIALQAADGTVYVITEEGELSRIFDTALHVSWAPDGLLLLAQTSHNELFVHNVDNERLTYIPIGEHSLITRLSQNIAHPQWFAGSQHVVFQIDDDVVLMEIDTRDHPIRTTLLSAGTMNARTTVGEDGESIFFIRNMNNTSELIELLLVAEL